MLLQATCTGGNAASATGGAPPPGTTQQNALHYSAVGNQHQTPTWTAHATKDNRIYYCNHVTRVAGWLPPAEQWGVGEEESLPYGWEQAIDAHGKPYYINHVNKTTTYEAPELEVYGVIETPVPEPRSVLLERSPSLGFGFVAGSERPVIVRFVTENGPSVAKLLPGDEILSVNGEDVRSAPRERVISMVRASERTVRLTVCQPVYGSRGGVTAAGRKSTLLSAGKRARLRAKPPRVRFAESVCVNGAPLFPPSAFSLGEMCAPPMANVLKVFLENGQTKSFKYDANTSVQDVVTSLQSKLCLTATEHFSLVVEHIKSLRRNKLTLLDPQDTLARIASRPGAHKLRCLFRVAFVPVSATVLAQRDPNALDYLYTQCCNDVAQERFAPELQPDTALRLAALHMHQHALANNMSTTKLTVKTIEREFGLERFLPASLLENIKRKEVRRLVGHFLRGYSGGNTSGPTGNGGKALTPLQAKLHYLDLVAQLPSYGAKCFSAGPPRIATPTDYLETVLLVSPRFGLSQISAGHSSVPVPIARLEDMCEIIVRREDELNCSVSIALTTDRLLNLSLEERDACELALVLQGYHRVLTDKNLPVDREREPPPEDLAPPFLGQHNVVPAKWSYVDHDGLPLQRAAFMTPPRYASPSRIRANGLCRTDAAKRSNAGIDHVKPPGVDNNMNSQMSNKNQTQILNGQKYESNDPIKSLGYDLQSVVSMEILECGVVEARNEEVIRRVREMQRLVENSERYLSEQEQESRRREWHETCLDADSDSDSQVSNADDAPGPLKHSDSLLLLTQNQKIEATNGRLAFGALDALRSDVAQSESDTDSLTPTNSPIRNSARENGAIRTSFGLHSPDNGCKNEEDLRQYLKRLREHARMNDTAFDSDLSNLEANIDLYDLDPDIIDLTLLPPPQTPDELDGLCNLPAALSVPPISFADCPVVESEKTHADDRVSAQNRKLNCIDDENVRRISEMNIDDFLASVTVLPPTQQVTPAVELTPEEIMSYIIPPPPGDRTDDKNDSPPSTSVPKSKAVEFPVDGEPRRRNSSGSVDTNLSTFTGVGRVIEYATVDRKGAFSCCGKGKSERQDRNSNTIEANDDRIRPPPRNRVDLKPPDRPPKSVDSNGERPRSNSVSCDRSAPSLPPRDCSHVAPAHIFLPPKKPPLPPVPSIELRNRNKSPAPVLKNRTACIGSPHLQRNRNEYRDLENGSLSPESADLFSVVAADRNASANEIKRAVSTPTSPHLGRNARLTAVPINDESLIDNSADGRRTADERKKNGGGPLSLDAEYNKYGRGGGGGEHHSRTLSCSAIEQQRSSGGAVLARNKDGARFRETLLAKSDVALAGLLLRLDQVAAQCSAAQAHGGGRQMSEERFQSARDELTSHSLQLVTGSKCAVVAMSNPSSTDLPEHLASCLSILRRLTELSQDLTKHTTAPLQTRNLVLKVHGVTAAFRDLVNATTEHSWTGKLEEQLAYHAECLANVLATLLRSLRVFSP